MTAASVAAICSRALTTPGADDKPSVTAAQYLTSEEMSVRLASKTGTAASTSKCPTASMAISRTNGYSSLLPITNTSVVVTCDIVSRDTVTQRSELAHRSRTCTSVSCSKPFTSLSTMARSSCSSRGLAQSARSISSICSSRSDARILILLSLEHSVAQEPYFDNVLATQFNNHTRAMSSVDAGGRTLFFRPLPAPTLTHLTAHSPTSRPRAHASGTAPCAMRRTPRRSPGCLRRRPCRPCRRHRAYVGQPVGGFDDVEISALSVRLR